MNEYKLSVVVPTFNTGKFLLDLFDSLKEQSIGFNNIEVIFVDDASTDKFTIDLINELISEYSNCKAIFLKENSGFPGKPRNIGIENSSAEYVIVTDHDDTYEKDALKILYETITTNNADIVICNFNQVYENEIIPFKSFYNDKIEITDISKNKDFFKIPAAIWTRLFRKSFLLKNNIKFLEGMLAEDVYFGVITSFYASKIIYMPNFYGYNYKIRDSDEDKSTIHIRNKKYLEAILNGFLEISKMIKEENKEGYSDYIFKSHLTSWLYTIAISETNDNEKKELFNKSESLFKHYYVDDPFFKGKYKKLAKYLQNNEIDLSIKEVNKIKSSQKNINKSLKENNYKKLLKKIIKRI
ncbi:glycosyltransferase [Methanobrevibacter sp. OttesenSCG-928-K11]|nr:glycosyltransferase [Methanobrevibacter sp. OttesenSCG-928-K11]MDL2271168.1 glycosyltransferase [Methanobrevibacter sp. OttesenSCG-928-I08]